MTEHRIKKISAKMEKKLDKKRYIHTLAVAHTAACMAMCHGQDPYKAYLAGLLHDNAKCIPDEKKLSLCLKYGLEINKAEEAGPDLLHAKLGSYLAKKKYKITDGEILSAILYHTTGRPGMTDFEKIIYIADYIEIHRKNLPAMEKIRQMAFRDLNDCMLLILENTLTYLQAKGASIDEITRETYNYYKNIKQTRR